MTCYNGLRFLCQHFFSPSLNLYPSNDFFVYSQCDVLFCPGLLQPYSESIRPYINVWSHYVWTVYPHCFVLASLSVFFFSFTHSLSFHNNFLLSLSFYSLSSVLCSAVLFMSLCLWILLCSFATFYPHCAVLLCLSSVLTFFSFYITVSPE